MDENDPSWLREAPPGWSGVTKRSYTYPQSGACGVRCCCGGVGASAMHQPVPPFGLSSRDLINFTKRHVPTLCKTAFGFSLRSIIFACIFVRRCVCVCVCLAVATTNHDSDVIMIRVSTPPHRCAAALLLFAADRNCSTRGVFPAVTFLAPKLQQCPLGAANKVLL